MGELNLLSLPHSIGIPSNWENEACFDRIKESSKLNPLLQTSLGELREYNSKASLSIQGVDYRGHDANVKRIFKRLDEQFKLLEENLRLILDELLTSNCINEIAEFIPSTLKILTTISGDLHQLNSSPLINNSVIKDLHKKDTLQLIKGIQFVEASKWLLNFLQANIAMQHDNYNDACRLFNKLTNEEQNFKYVKQALSSLSSNLSEDILRYIELSKIEPQLKVWLDSISNRVPDILLKYLNQSVVVMKSVVKDKNQLAEGYKKLFDALEEQASAELLSYIGGELVGLGNNEYALKCLTLADKAFKKAGSTDLSLQLDITYNISLAYLHLNQFEQVLSIVNLLPELKSSMPRYSDMLYLKAIAFKHLENPEIAFEYFSQALKYANVDSIALKLDSEPARQLLKDAVQADKVDIAQLLLQKFPEFNVNFLVTEDKDTLLHFASSWSMFELLLEYKADLLLVNEQGITPIYKVINAVGGEINIPLIQYIKTHPQIQEAILATEFSYTFGKNIFQAAEEGSAKLVEQFIEIGIDVNSKNQHGQTALHRAAAKGDAKIVKFLLNHKAIVESAGEDITPLQLAVLYNHIEVATELLDKGADPNMKDGSGFTALHIAAEKGNKSMLTLLLEHNGNIKIMSEYDQSLLHCIAIGIKAGNSTCWDIIELLIQKGADPFTKDDKGREPRDILDNYDWSYAEKYDDILETLGCYTDTSNEVG